MPILKTKRVILLTVYRNNKEDGYVVVDNAILWDKQLSLKAKGLLIFMLTLPKNWVFSIRGLAYYSKDGVDSVSSAVEELESAGYLVRRRTRNNGKYGAMEYDIYEKPVQDFHVQEKSKKEHPTKEKPPQPNKDTPNIDISNIDITYHPSTNPDETEWKIREQIEYDVMCQRYDSGQLDNLVSLMTEMMLCDTDTIPVGKNKSYPAEYVRSCISKISPLHIEMLLDSLIENRPEIRNVRGYLLSALINAVNTLEMDSRYGEGSRL